MADPKDPKGTGFKPATSNQKQPEPPPPHAAGAPTTGQREAPPKDAGHPGKGDEHGKAKGLEKKPAPKDAPEGEVQYAPNIPQPLPPEKQWQAYAVQAINGLYPRLRDGVDYAVGRRTYDGDIELLDQGEGVDIDWGKVTEAAKRLVATDPYADYKPRASLASTHKVEGHGEVPPRRGEERPSLPQDISQSEANPKLEGRDKHYSQPYVEGQVAEDQLEEEDEKRRRK